MQRRRYGKQEKSLEERLRLEAAELRAQAAKLKPGPKQNELIRRAALADEGAGMSEWLRPPDQLFGQKEST